MLSILLLISFCFICNAFNGRFRACFTSRVSIASLPRTSSSPRPLVSQTPCKYFPRLCRHQPLKLASMNVGARDDGEQFQPTVYVTDEQMSDWLDDMIYSGDIPGYMLRNSKDVVTEDFFEYLGERIESCDDPDEKRVFQDVYKMLEERLRMTDGLIDSGVVFENRLDKILFTAPNLRKALIEEKLDEMTDGFIEYVQKELKTTSDSDSKVVLASILQMIGQLKNADLLGKDATVLKAADATLGDQYAKKPDLLLQKDVVGDRNEIILASLMFSKNDILEDILNNLHEINDEFTAYLQKKVDTAQDMEERVGLSSLLDTVTTVLNRVKEVQGDTVQEIDEELTMDQVRKRMQEVQIGQEIEAEKKKKGDFGTFSVKADKKETFQEVFKRFQNLPEEVTLRMAVEANYELCDYQFMEMLKSEAQACYNEGADIEAKLYEEVYDMINVVMASKIGSAQERLQRILEKRSLPAMETESIRMVKKNEVDEALVLLIKANAQQAEQAGAVQAAQVLRKLNERINMEKERLLPDEQRLLRALLRVSDSEERKALLFSAFKPQKIMGDDGQISEREPLISPPSFINVVRNFISNFGNVEGFDIMGRSRIIIDEAQLVATELYGEGMTPRQQQKYMFEKKTLSVWDLADWENTAEYKGDEIPWLNNSIDGKNPEDVLHDRVKKIGGADSEESGFRSDRLRG